MFQTKSEIVKDKLEPNLKMEVKKEFVSNENKSYEEILAEMNALPKIDNINKINKINEIGKIEKKEDSLINDILGLNSGSTKNNSENKNYNFDLNYNSNLVIQQEK